MTDFVVLVRFAWQRFDIRLALHALKCDEILCVFACVIGDIRDYAKWRDRNYMFIQS